MSDVRKLYDNLRDALVGLLIQGSWDDIQADHERVQLRWRPEFKPGWGKPKYVRRVLGEFDDAALTALGQRCLEVFTDKSTNALQDALWWIEASGVPQLSEVTRRAIAQTLDGRVISTNKPPREFLDSFATTRDASFLAPTVEYGSNGVLYQVQHDLAFLFGSKSAQPPTYTPYSHEQLLGEYGFFQWPDKRVLMFLEQLVHPTVRASDEIEWVGLLNPVLSADGFELVEAERVSKRPVFRVRRRMEGIRGRPKNLIFASNGPKPELGLKDALDNDVVILKNAEHCLVYEERIDEDGLTWEALISWWATINGHGPMDPSTRRTLGRRLLDSLGSPPERALFEEYFKQFAPVLGTRLPALLPQVYLHYDPLTVRQLAERGEGVRFPVQRMDFLLLLRDHVRVVLEVDGQQHYSEGEGAAARPSPKLYAEMVKADRGLRLAGYEVFRFGGYELNGSVLATATVRDFFGKLFRRHGLLK